MRATYAVIVSGLACLIFGLANELRAQDVSPEEFARWAARNSYRADRDFRSYLLIAPGNLGPNGLPVLPTVRGRVDSVLRFRGSSTGYFASGDQAIDLRLNADIPFGSRASLHVWYTLREWYDYDDAVALQRNTLRSAGAGSAAGDVYVAGRFQVLRQRRRGLDVALRIVVKTASGGDIEAMRFTDSPGYAFDGSFGKDFSTAGGRWTWRPYLSGGFYVWQRFGAANPQNDAATYAVGLQLSRASEGSRSRHSVSDETQCRPLNLRTELAGYSGYEGVQDAPLVLRVVGAGHLAGRWGWRVQVQQGVHDYAYTSAALGVDALLWGVRIH